MQTFLSKSKDLEWAPDLKRGIQMSQLSSLWIGGGHCWAEDTGEFTRGGVAPFQILLIHGWNTQFNRNIKSHAYSKLTLSNNICKNLI